VEVSALEAAAGLDFWAANNAALFFMAFSRHPETSVATCHAGRGAAFHHGLLMLDVLLMNGWP
jgi:hypothetical protein